jgi:uncharacterized membrane protein
MSHLTIVFIFASFAAGLLVGSAFVRSVGGFVAYLLLYLAGFVFVAAVVPPAARLIDDIFTAFVCGSDDPARYED